MTLTLGIFLLIFGVGVILTFRNPFFGVLLYIFEWHNHPSYWWWGRALPDIRWSYFIAILILLSCIINRHKFEDLDIDYKPFIWLALFCLNAYLVSFFYALDSMVSIEKSLVLLKIAINCVLFLIILRRPKQYNILILLYILCVANFGRIAYETGSHRDLEIRAPGATDGNFISAYVMMTLPFFATLFFQGRRWHKILVLISIPFVLNLLIIENSRSSILGLIAMAILSLFLFKSKTRLKIFVALVFAGILFFHLTNVQFWERQSTTFEDKDVGAGRLALWAGALKMMKDYPMGLGADGYKILVFDYVPELEHVMLVKGPKTVHNTFLNVATDWGVIGLFLYLGFICHAFFVLLKIRIDAKKYPEFDYYTLNSTALILSLTGALVAAFFQNQQYAEIIYWFCTFAICLRNMQISEIYYLLKKDYIQLESFDKINWKFNQL